VQRHGGACVLLHRGQRCTGASSILKFENKNALVSFLIQNGFKYLGQFNQNKAPFHSVGGRGGWGLSQTGGRHVGSDLETSFHSSTQR
jgi:hypothetical protein